MSRGGYREPGPGKRLGRPRLAPGDRRERCQVYLSEGVWQRLDNLLPPGKSTPVRVSNMLRGLASGEQTIVRQPARDTDLFLGARKKRTLRVRESVWLRVVELFDQDLGVGGDTPGQIVAEGLRRYALGHWRAES